MGVSLVLRKLFFPWRLFDDFKDLLDLGAVVASSAGKPADMDADHISDHGYEGARSAWEGVGFIGNTS